MTASPRPLHEALSDDLRFLGEDVEIEERITEVYLLAVRNPGITRARLVAAAIPPNVVDLATHELTVRGLVRPGGEPDSWEAIPPDIALPAMAARLDRRAANARALTTELATLYSQVRAPSIDPGADFQVLQNLQELHDATSAVSSSAEHELRAMYDGSPRTAFVFAKDDYFHRERVLGPDGRPVRRRTVFDTAIPRLPRAGEVLQARLEGGEEYRFVGGVPFSVLIADDVQAVVDLTSFDSSGTGSILVRDRRLVLALGALVESYWKVATPMATASDGGATLDRRSITILSLLAAGATDATIAANSGISQRTVERKIRALMDQLGATTRFQAGVQAARRGWL